MALIGGAYSTTATITNTDDRWWLKDPVEPSLNMTIDVINEELNLHKKEQQAKFFALGRQRPVVVRDVIQGIDSSPLHLDFIGEESFDNFEALRNRQRTLLLQTPMYGRQWYISFDTDMEERWINTADAYRKVFVSLIEVDKP